MFPSTPEMRQAPRQADGTARRGALHPRGGGGYSFSSGACRLPRACPRGRVRGTPPRIRPPARNPDARAHPSPNVPPAASSLPASVSPLGSGFVVVPTMKQEPPEMSEISPEKSEKCPEKSEVYFMSAVAEAAHLLRQIAEPRPAGDKIKAAIDRAARRVTRFMPASQRMSFRRAEDLWRGEARAVRAEEMDAIRAAAKTDRRLGEEARNELSEIDARIARLEALLVQDEDFHRDQVAAHRAALRRLDRPMD